MVKLLVSSSASLFLPVRCLRCALTACRPAAFVGAFQDLPRGSAQTVRLKSVYACHSSRLCSDRSDAKNAVSAASARTTLSLNLMYGEKRIYPHEEARPRAKAEVLLPGVATIVGRDRGHGSRGHCSA
jgi:hypothetical protein